MKRPQCNKWYADEDREIRLEVIDLTDDYIVVQSLDGSVSEYSVEAWDELGLIPLTTPGDWVPSWGCELSMEESDERYDHSKRTVRLQKEDVIEEIDEFAFPDDLEETSDFEGH